MGSGLPRPGPVINGLLKRVGARSIGPRLMARPPVPLARDFSERDLPCCGDCPASCPKVSRARVVHACAPLGRRTSRASSGNSCLGTRADAVVRARSLQVIP